MTLPTVPIVLGHTDYSLVAPHGSYVDASKYRTPMDLANHLKHLIKDEKAYEKHLKWKEEHRLVTSTMKFQSSSNKFLFQGDCGH